MRILGIDPGLALTGYGCVELPEAGDEPVLLEAGVLRLDRRRPMSARLGQLFRDLGEVLAELAPQTMVVEELFSHARHVRTSILMGHARGVVLLAGELAGIELREMPATEVKKAITGNGHAAKRQVQLAVMTQLGLAAPPEPPDVADAIAIAVCAARRLAVERSAVPGAR